ncbi:hypothetical protein BS17DRAFT_807496 [Gyrodon lividus]|nr:hypothetical protein BS17DRAFT_807496 [Gyrodon lividus]
MARTKQTAQLTTGGARPLQQLKTKNKGHAPHANLIVEDVDVGTDVSDDAEAGSHPSSPLTSLPPSSPVQSLPVQVLRSMQDEEMQDKEMHNELCSLCQDGGEILYCCNHCPQVVCGSCLVVLAELSSIVKQPDVDFICPSCHELMDIRLRGGKSRRAYAPYWTFTHLNETQDPVLPTYPVLSSHFAMSAQSQVNGTKSEGTPPDAIAKFLWPYFRSTDLQYIEQEFNFGTQAKYRTHICAMLSLRQQIHTIPTGRVLLFISTHSKEQRGDLFAGQEGLVKNPKPVAVEVDKFFRMLLAGDFASLLNGATIVLLTCGWLVQHAELFGQL